MIEKIFQKLLKKAYPNRNFEAVKIGRRIFTVTHDCIGGLTYSLYGTYSYEEVRKLNELITYSARYGYCPGKGTVAIISFWYDRKDQALGFSDVWESGETQPLLYNIFVYYGENII